MSARFLWFCIFPLTFTWKLMELATVVLLIYYSHIHSSVHPSMRPSSALCLYLSPDLLSFSLNLSIRQSPFSQHWTFRLYGSLNISLPASLSSLSPNFSILSLLESIHQHTPHTLHDSHLKISPLKVYFNLMDHKAGAWIFSVCDCRLEI